ncbi:MAG: 5-bromo-4-chloroindolyl phosphate hydrolysis family protein [Lachnospiraceae bacterium]|nr:5-bromo-4-chloroindolyl phosphate hydrolysis family protein [Lachnospiraceae bacterium]
MEAELAKARAAEQAKIDAEKLAEEQRKKNAQIKKEQEQSLIDKYKVPKRQRTGDSAIDKMLDEEEKAIAEMRRLDDGIEDERVSAQIVHLEDVTTKIVDYVVQHPSKKNSVRRFFNYYLPTAVKLLNSYDRMDDTGISGENIDATKEQVEEMMDKALEAFDKQLDSLYADEAMDVSSEIKVMENLLAQEGLTDEMNIPQLKL